MTGFTSPSVVSTWTAPGGASEPQGSQREDGEHEEKGGYPEPQETGSRVFASFGHL